MQVGDRGPFVVGGPHHFCTERLETRRLDCAKSVVSFGRIDDLRCSLCDPLLGLLDIQLEPLYVFPVQVDAFTDKNNRIPGVCSRVRPVGATLPVLFPVALRFCLEVIVNSCNPPLPFVLST